MNGVIEKEQTIPREGIHQNESNDRQPWWEVKLISCAGPSLSYRPVFFDWPALLYTPIQPARAQKCGSIKNEPSIIIPPMIIDIDQTFNPVYGNKPTIQ